MAKHASSCDHHRLRLLLADELTPEIESVTSDHLITCHECRRALENLAGDQDWWDEVKSLSSQDLDLIESGSSTSSSHSLHDCFSGRDANGADFAVEFLEPCDTPRALGLLDDIEILEVIGQGGMGVVLRGYQPALGRYVAVKVMAPHLAASGSARKRFAREARAAAAIVNPHVMAIHSVNASCRLPYFVMPFAACESLQQRLDREGQLELKEILRIGHHVATGLAAAHAQGLVHRDVKPANVLLEKGVDRAMLTDFGLARAVDDASLTRTGVIAGTPQFMSPEQARGEPVDVRSDLFSFGSVLYTMCAGRVPFRAETSLGVLRRITDVNPRPIREINVDMPEWLEVISQRLLEKDPAARYGSAQEVAELLGACLSHIQLPNVARLPQSLTSQSQNRRIRKGVRMLAKGLAGLGVIGFALLAIIFVRQNRGRTSDMDVISPLTTQQADAIWNDATTEEIAIVKKKADLLELEVQNEWESSVPLLTEEQSLPQSGPEAQQ